MTSQTNKNRKMRMHYFDLSIREMVIISFPCFYVVSLTMARNELSEEILDMRVTDKEESPVRICNIK